MIGQNSWMLLSCKNCSNILKKQFLQLSSIHDGHHGCYLAVKIVSNILEKAQGRKYEKEWIQYIDFIVIIPFGIIIWNYLCKI